mgnify:CR=1 FL=1
MPWSWEAATKVWLRSSMPWHPCVSDIMQIIRYIISFNPKFSFQFWLTYIYYFLSCSVACHHSTWHWVTIPRCIFWIPSAKHLMIGWSSQFGMVASWKWQLITLMVEWLWTKLVFLLPLCCVAPFSNIIFRSRFVLAVVIGIFIILIGPSIQIVLWMPSLKIYAQNQSAILVQIPLEPHFFALTQKMKAWGTTFLHFSMILN